MLQYVLLLATVLCISASQLVQKQYNVKTKEPHMLLFVSLTSFAAILVFLLASGGRLVFSTEIIGYSAAFAAGYIASCVGLLYALRYGPMSITLLVSAYSLMIPTLYGIIFLNEPMGAASVTGMVLLLVSLFLLNMKKEQTRFSVKWLVFLVVSFVGNGLCSTMQKVQQIHCDGAYKNEFMILALAISGVALLIFALTQSGVRQAFPQCLKFSVLNGMFNGGNNLFVMILTGLVPNAVLYPTVSAGGIVLSCVAALLIYKEKLSGKQIVGYIIGVVSVVLLNI